MVSRWALAAALLAVAPTATGGCDSSFTPFDGSERYYSVFGFLDTGAETQWVRVEALQDSMLGSPDPLGATVTLENVSTGETARLRESIDTVEGYDLHHFSTSELDVRPEETYRLTIERESDGATSTATTETPEDFPSPRVEGRFPPQCNPDTPPPRVPVTVRGVERLGGAKAVLGDREIGYLDEAEQIGDEAFRFWVEGQCPSPVAVRFAVGAAGPGWPEFEAEDDDFAGPLFTPLPGPDDPLPIAGAGNIENGVGFFGGAVIKTVTIPIER